MSDPGASGWLLAALGLGALLSIAAIFCIDAIARSIETLKVRYWAHRFRRAR